MILTGFTRPVQGDTSGNPIVSEDLRSWIASHTSLTITGVTINPSTIDVTGTIVSGDTSNIQTAINSYIYPTPTMPYIPTSNLTNTVPMVDDSSKVVTAHAAYTVDTSILAVANSKTAVRYYDNGVAMNGSANTGDVVIWIDSATTSSGSVTFYLTSDHTSGGTAICSSISGNSVDASATDSTGAFSRGIATVAGNLKSVTVPLTKLTATGLTLLATTVLGSIQNTAVPDGVVVKIFAMGVAA